MAAKLDVSALTLNAKETPGFDQFVSERMYDQPGMAELVTVRTGVTMKERVSFASLFGKTGISDTSCARPESGAKSTATEKTMEPSPVGDTLINCQADINSLFKPYFDKIANYQERFDISGSDEEMFLLAMATDAAQKAAMRYAWLGDTDVAQAGSSSAGLISADDVKFYSAADGIWKSIFAAVTAGDLPRVTIDENAEDNTAAQEDLSATAAIDLFEEMWNKADSRLRSDLTAQFYVSRGYFENYRKYLQNKGENFTIDYTTEGIMQLNWNGHRVINMETVWDLNIKGDFVKDTDTNAYYLPNRALLTTPSNLVVSTLNDGDMDELDAWYEKKSRENYMAYGFTIHGLYLEGYMGVVAY